MSIVCYGYAFKPAIASGVVRVPYVVDVEISTGIELLDVLLDDTDIDVTLDGAIELCV